MDISKTYTLQQVRDAIHEHPGVKFSHPYFSNDEYIYGDENGVLTDESGLKLPEDEFFELRELSMSNNWYITE